MPQDPYLRWMLGRGVPRTERGGAVVVRAERAGGTGLVALGTVADQPAAVRDAHADAVAAGVAITRVSVHPDAFGHLTVGVEAPAARWEWMLHDGRAVARPDGVGWLDATWHAVLSTLLADHSPTAHAHPGDADVHGWAGVVVDGELIAAGAAVRSPAGWPHLRAIVVRPDHRGGGIGTAVTAFLTADALARTGTCSLSHYSDNAEAHRLYGRLGYRTLRRFASAPVRA